MLERFRIWNIRRKQTLNIRHNSGRIKKSQSILKCYVKSHFSANNFTENLLQCTLWELAFCMWYFVYLYFDYLATFPKSFDRVLSENQIKKSCWHYRNLFLLWCFWLFVIFLKYYLIKSMFFLFNKKKLMKLSLLLLHKSVSGELFILHLSIINYFLRPKLITCLFFKNHARIALKKNLLMRIFLKKLPQFVLLNEIFEFV